jgi:thiol-disulfide isomerase/thioredoxin
MNKQNLLLLGVAFTSLFIGGVVYQHQQADFISIQGHNFKWSTMQEQTVVVNYFAEWCAPCLKEVPELNAFEKWTTSQPDVEFIAVSYDPLSAQKLTEIIARYDMQFPVIGATGDNFPIDWPQYLPATFIVKSGNISKPLLGEQTVESLIKAVLAQP